MAHAEDFDGVDIEHLLSRAGASIYLAEVDDGNTVIGAAATCAAT